MGTLHQITLPLLNMLLYITLIMHSTISTSRVDLTLGFIHLPLNSSNLRHHKPYNLPLHKRYSFRHGVHKLWGHDYSSGVWQFEGQGYVPCGTSGVSIMQVFGSDPPHATTLMVRTYNGSLSYYRGPVLVQNIWDRWFYLNVIHDVEACNVKVYVDGVLVLEAPGRGGSSHYFKFGVYAQNDPSYYMESRWKGIRVLKKCS
ncbi:citrate-binding protein-like isoform X2 [Lotus japonicus]|uniref:citrate-binding protein-like isoform X2 n=1 Tax=Lotus japonicus TaxID=34305 RepID=UPI002589970B|nr:citrate-binding protein-like isoform X2 [Lotus japonicus]